MNTPPRFTPFLLRSIYFFQIVFLGAAYYLRNKGYSVDDSFITFRYAYHLKEGFGLVFNVGENYYGTTAAGYAVVLAIVSSALDVLFRLAGNANLPTIQNVSVAFSALSLGVIAACLPFVFRASKSASHWIVCAVFATYLFVGFPFNEVAGHETYAFLGIAFLATVLAENRQAMLSGLILGVAAAFRPDAVLLVPILVLFGWIQSQLGWRAYLANRNFWRFCIGFALVVVPWLLYLWLHFGQPTPGTMDAKRAQVALGSWPLYNPINLLKYLASSGFAVLSIMSIGLLATFWLLIKHWGFAGLYKDRGIFIALVWLLFGLGSVCAYFLFNVTFWNWYGVPVLFSLGVPCFVGWRIISDKMSSTSAQLTHNKNYAALVRISPAIILLGVLLSGYGKFSTWYSNPHISSHIHAYEDIARYLVRAEPAGTTIQMCEPGSFGFGLGPKFKVIDELGLVTPAVAKALLNGDYGFATRTYKAKYLVCSCALPYLECAKSDLLEHYDFVGQGNVNFWGPKIGHGARLFRRKLEAPN
ncbi:MAG: hypothetical protein HOO95_01435 [Gallionella sp.]|nr:hypothetical protein [Gallionella sp.]